MNVIVVVSFICCSLLCVIVGEEFCHTEEFVADCPQTNEFVLMTSATYGRMAKGRCVRTDFGYVGCYIDVMDQLHERCSGRTSCAVRIPDARLDSTRPCNEDLKSYLDADYTCITALMTADSCDLKATTSNMTGYLSGHLPPSMTSPNAACGSDKSPWTVIALPGQRINFTLLDFTSNSTLHSGGAVAAAFSSSNLDALPEHHHHNGAAKLHSHRVFHGGISGTGGVADSLSGMDAAAEGLVGGEPVQCDVYARLDEELPTHTDTVEVCGGGRNRIALVYTSVSHRVKVRLHHRGPANGGHNYLIKYEAVGCPDLPSSKYMWSKRENDHLTVGCKGTVQDSSETTSWTLVCSGTTWVGISPNCSTFGSNDARRDEFPALSLGASILIVIAVSLAIGVAVLIFGLYYMKNKRCRNALNSDVPMRDLKPLNSDTYDATNSVYARNNAFQPTKVVKSSSSRDKTGNGGVGDETMEYEYVWDASTSDTAVVGHTENRPDLVRIEKSPSSSGAGNLPGSRSDNVSETSSKTPHVQPNTGVGSAATAPRCRCIHKSTPTASPERRPMATATLNRMEYQAPNSNNVVGSGTDFSPPPLPVKMRDAIATGVVSGLVGSPATSTGIGTPLRTCQHCGVTTSPTADHGPAHCCSPASIPSSTTTPGTGSLPRRCAWGGMAPGRDNVGSPNHHVSSPPHSTVAAAATAAAAAGVYQPQQLPLVPTVTVHGSSATITRRQFDQQAPPPSLL